jgi:methylmalonyl-CoA mutase cobalamin-binding domain/chain
VSNERKGANEMNQRLIDAMADLDDDEVLKIIEVSLEESIPATEILADLQEGIKIVGDRFSKQEYFLSELMLSGKLFKDAQILLADQLATAESKYIGEFILGTVKSDIHDIGKNIVSSVLESNGFKVIDLGVDVPAENFVQAIRTTDAKVVGMSCLLTTAFEGIKNTVTAIEEAGLRDGRLLIIGGGPTDQSTVVYSGADMVCKTAQDAANVAKKFLRV